MGAVGNKGLPTSVRLNQIMRSMRDKLTLEGLRSAIEEAKAFSDNLR